MTNRMKRRGLLGVLVVGAGALALALGSALPAAAAGDTIDDPTANQVITSSTYDVSGSIETGDEVVVTVCQYGSGGTKCAYPYTSGSIASGAWLASSVSIPTSFSAYDYTQGVPPTANGSVACKTSSTDTTAGRVQCSVYASFYDSSDPSAGPVGGDEVPIYVNY